MPKVPHPGSTKSSAAPDIAANLASFAPHLRPRTRRRPRSRPTPRRSTSSTPISPPNGMPRAVAHIRREHLEAFLVDPRGRRPATGDRRRSAYRSLQQFFKWLRGEDEIPASPMAKMKPAHVPAEPPEVLRDEELRRLLDACPGHGFRRPPRHARSSACSSTPACAAASCRAKARRSTSTTSRVVIGKGRRPRACRSARKTAKALDRYLRVRAAPADAASDWLWLGKRGRLTDTGIEQIVSAAAAQAGLPGPPAPVPPYLRPPVARGRRQRGRPHAPRRLESRQMLEPLRRLGRRRAGARRATAPQPGRQAVKEDEPPFLVGSDQPPAGRGNAYGC